MLKSMDACQKSLLGGVKLNDITCYMGLVYIPYIMWENVVNPDDLLSPQEWLAQLFDQPPEQAEA